MDRRDRWQKSRGECTAVVYGTVLCFVLIVGQWLADVACNLLVRISSYTALSLCLLHVQLPCRQLDDTADVQTDDLIKFFFVSAPGSSFTWLPRACMVGSSYWTLQGDLLQITSARGHVSDTVGRLNGLLTCLLHASAITTLYSVCLVADRSSPFS